MSVPMKRVLGLAVLAGGCALGAMAQQKPLPDAQVESNVLRALASAPELSTQNIQSTTVYGVVTLSGSANDEASRTRAENLVARAEGVKKVVDEMTLGQADAAANAGQPAQTANNDNMPPQQDGAYPPPPAHGQAGPPPPLNGQANDDSYGAPPPSNHGQYPPRRAMYGEGAPHPVYGGQVGGEQVTIPNGAMMRIRINEGLNTHHTAPGSVFDGTVLNDVIADGAVAIPRGAAVQGTVVQSKDSGALKGRSELALQLTSLSMGGKTYTLASDVWTRTGQDKTSHTVGSAIGLGALGALFGAVAGGGAGAAIGAGVGGAAGVASSAASPNGRIIIPPEAVLTFHLAQPATVATVSEAEMQRLSYAVGPSQARPIVRRYPPAYYAPYGPY